MRDLAELGRYLKQQRELRGVSRDDLSRTTRLSPGLIAALEEGQADKLPEPVFIQNSVRSYAKAIGLPVDDVLDRLLAIPGVLPPTEQSPIWIEARRRSQAYRAVAILLMVLFAFAIGLYAWKRAG